MNKAIESRALNRNATISTLPLFYRTKKIFDAAKIEGSRNYSEKAKVLKKTFSCLAKTKQYKLKDMLQKIDNRMRLAVLHQNKDNFLLIMHENICKKNTKRKRAIVPKIGAIRPSKKKKTAEIEEKNKPLNSGNKANILATPSKININQQNLSIPNNLLVSKIPSKYNNPSNSTPDNEPTNFFTPKSSQIIPTATNKSSVSFFKCFGTSKFPNSNLNTATTSRSTTSIKSINKMTKITPFTNPKSSTSKETPISKFSIPITKKTFSISNKTPQKFLSTRPQSKLSNSLKLSSKNLIEATTSKPKIPIPQSQYPIVVNRVNLVVPIINPYTPIKQLPSIFPNLKNINYRYSKNNKPPTSTKLSNFFNSSSTTNKPEASFMKETSTPTITFNHTTPIQASKSFRYNKNSSNFYSKNNDPPTSTKLSDIFNSSSATNKPEALFMKQTTTPTITFNHTTPIQPSKSFKYKNKNSSNLSVLLKSLQEQVGEQKNKIEKQKHEIEEQKNKIDEQKNEIQEQKNEIELKVETEKNLKDKIKKIEALKLKKSNNLTHKKACNFLMNEINNQSLTATGKKSLQSLFVRITKSRLFKIDKLNGENTDDKVICVGAKGGNKIWVELPKRDSYTKECSEESYRLLRKFWFKIGNFLGLEKVDLVKVLESNISFL